MIDTFEKLNTELETVDYIIHIADIHIRLTKRHDEYKEIFNKVYAEIKKTTKNTIIILAGDLTHSKVDLSPECVQLMTELLKGMADLRPTVIIAGNHDCLLTNTTRLDSISPIVDALNHKSLFYLKESKLYGLADVLINNMCVFTDHTEFVKIKNVSRKLLYQFNCKIALFHGGVFNAKFGDGLVVTNKNITVDMFDGHDIALLGDIHNPQTMYIQKEVDESELDEYIKSGEWELVEEKL